MSGTTTFKLALFLSVTIISAVNTVNSFQCYVCDDCDEVNEDHLQTCTSSTSTQTPTVTESEPTETVTDTPTPVTGTGTSTDTPISTETNVPPTESTVTGTETEATATETDIPVPTPTGTAIPSTETTVTDTEIGSTATVTGTETSTTETTLSETETPVTEIDTTATIIESTPTAQNETANTEEIQRTDSVNEGTVTTESARTPTFSEREETASIDSGNNNKGTIKSDIIIEAQRKVQNDKVVRVRRTIGEHIKNHRGFIVKDCACNNEENCDCNNRYFSTQNLLPRDDEHKFVCVKSKETVDGIEITKRGCAIERGDNKTCENNGYSANCIICEAEKCNSGASLQIPVILLALVVSLKLLK